MLNLEGTGMKSIDDSIRKVIIMTPSRAAFCLLHRYIRETYPSFAIGQVGHASRFYDLYGLRGPKNLVLLFGYENTGERARILEELRIRGLKAQYVKLGANNDWSFSNIL